MKRPPPLIIHARPWFMTAILQCHSHQHGRWNGCMTNTPLNRLRQRISAALLVFTGRADAIVWPHNQ